MIPAEPRTHLDMLKDLLERVEEWPERHHPCPRGGYFGMWETACPTCEADGADYRTREHAPGCALAALLLEVRTYLEVEEQLASESATQVRDE